MNIINRLIEIYNAIMAVVAAIESTPAAGGNDCGCPDNTPSNYPPLDPEANQPPIDFEDDYEVGSPTTSYDNICKGSIALTQILVHNLDKFKEVILLGDINFKSVLPYLASTSLGGVGVAVSLSLILPVTGVAILAVVAGLIVLVSVFGYQSVVELDEAINDLLDQNIFYCGWLDADTFDAGILAESARSSVRDMASWHWAVRNLVLTMIFQERVAAVVAGRRFDKSVSPPVEEDWPEWDAIIEDCDCNQDYDELWVDFLGWSPNLVGGNCLSHRFDDWKRRDTGATIPDTARIAAGAFCGGGGTVQPNLAGISGFEARFGQASAYAQEFSIAIAGDYELEWAIIQNGQTDSGVAWTLDKWDGSTWQSLGSGAGRTAGPTGVLWTDTLENLDTGLYRLGFWRSASTFAGFVVHAVLRSSTS